MENTARPTVLGLLPHPVDELRIDWQPTREKERGGRLGRLGGSDPDEASEGRAVRGPGGRAGNAPPHQQATAHRAVSVSGGEREVSGTGGPRVSKAVTGAVSTSGLHAHQSENIGYCSNVVHSTAMPCGIEDHNRKPRLRFISLRSV
jgi:hypothetical protein